MYRIFALGGCNGVVCISELKELNEIVVFNSGSTDAQFTTKREYKIFIKHPLRKKKVV